MIFSSAMVSVSFLNVVAAGPVTTESRAWSVSACSESVGRLFTAFERFTLQRSDSAIASSLSKHRAACVTAFD